MDSQELQDVSMVIGRAPPTIIQIPGLNSLNNTTDSKMPADAQDNNDMQLRKMVLQQTQDKIREFSALRIAWSFAYYFLGILALLSNILVLALTSFSLSQYITGEVNGFYIRDIIITVCGAVSTITLTLNTILRSNMNATYFQEAVTKYIALEVLIWQDLSAATDRFEQLNQKYCSQGVGTMFNINTINNALSGIGVPKNGAKIYNKKRYAYPKPSKNNN